MKRSVLLACIALLVAGCGQGMTVSQDAHSLEVVFDTHKKDVLNQINKDFQKTPMPVQSRQLKIYSFLSVHHCARRRLQHLLDLPAGSGENQKTVLDKIISAETSCAEELIANTLVYSGADRATEVSILLRGVNENYSKTVIPTYVSVD